MGDGTGKPAFSCLPIQKNQDEPLLCFAQDPQPCQHKTDLRRHLQLPGNPFRKTYVVNPLKLYSFFVVFLTLKLQ